MGQNEIIDLLIKIGRPLSRGQISNLLEQNEIKVSHSIKRLLKWNGIKCFELDRYQAAEFLGEPRPHRRKRFYYCNDETLEELKNRILLCEDCLKKVEEMKITENINKQE